MACRRLRRCTARRRRRAGCRRPIEARADVDIIVADRLTKAGRDFRRPAKLRAFVLARSTSATSMSMQPPAGVLSRAPGPFGHRWRNWRSLHGRLSRGMSRATADYHSGRKPEIVMGPAASGNSLGIQRYGSIGQYSRHCKGTRMEVLVADPLRPSVTRHQASVARRPSERSDYVVCLQSQMKARKI